MTLLVAPSDGGGNPLDGDWWWVPLAVSGAALLITLAKSMSDGWRHSRTSVEAYHNLLTSSDLTKARDLVGEAARVKPARVVGPTGEQVVKDWNEERVSKFRPAIFQVMWALEAAHIIQKRHLRNSAVASEEGVPVYRHIERMVDDLSAALENWGDFFKWQDTGKSVNETLDRLPTLRGSWERKMATPTSVRLPVPPPAATSDGDADGDAGDGAAPTEPVED